jgi:hypothetical protein
MWYKDLLNNGRNSGTNPGTNPGRPDWKQARQTWTDTLTYQSKRTQPRNHAKAKRRITPPLTLNTQFHISNTRPLNHQHGDIFMRLAPATATIWGGNSINVGNKVSAGLDGRSASGVVYCDRRWQVRILARCRRSRVKRNHEFGTAPCTPQFGTMSAVSTCQLTR